MKSFLPLIFILSVLSACDESQHLRQKLKTSAQTQTHFVDYPTFKLKAYGRMRNSRQKDKYIFDKVSRYIQDQMVKNANFSDAYYLLSLSRLPKEMQLLYATYYVERESALDGFSGYIKRTGGFLAPQAIEGYRLLGLQEQARLMQELFTSTQVQVALQDLDLAWPELALEARTQRVQFMTEHVADWSQS